jgi:hypothetical protein
VLMCLHCGGAAGQNMVGGTPAAANDLSQKSQSEPFYEWAIERAKPICKRVAMRWRMTVTLVNGMIMLGPGEGPNHFTSTALP